MINALLLAGSDRSIARSGLGILRLCHEPTGSCRKFPVLPHDDFAVIWTHR